MDRHRTVSQNNLLLFHFCMKYIYILKVLCYLKLYKYTKAQYNNYYCNHLSTKYYYHHNGLSKANCQRHTHLRIFHYKLINIQFDLYNTILNLVGIYLNIRLNQFSPHHRITHLVLVPIFYSYNLINKLKDLRHNLYICI